MSQEQGLRRVAALTSDIDGAQKGLNVVEHFHTLSEEERMEIIGTALQMLTETPEFSALAGMLSTWKIAGDIPLEQELAVQCYVGPHTVTLMLGFTPEAMARLEGVE